MLLPSAVCGPAAAVTIHSAQPHPGHPDLYKHAAGSLHILHPRPQTLPGSSIPVLPLPLPQGKLEPDARAALVAKGQALKESLSALEAQLVVAEEQLQAAAQKLPNLTHPAVPLGGEELATVLKVNGEQRKFEFTVGAPGRLCVAHKCGSLYAWRCRKYAA